MLENSTQSLKLSHMCAQKISNYNSLSDTHPKSSYIGLDMFIFSHCFFHSISLPSPINLWFFLGKEQKLAISDTYIGSLFFGNKRYNENSEFPKAYVNKFRNHNWIYSTIRKELMSHVYVRKIFWINPSPRPFLYESKPQPARRGRVKDPRGFLQNPLKKDDIQFASLCYFDVDV